MGIPVLFSRPAAFAQIQKLGLQDTIAQQLQASSPPGGADLPPVPAHPDSKPAAKAKAEPQPESKAGIVGSPEPVVALPVVPDPPAPPEVSVKTEPPVPKEEPPPEDLISFDCAPVKAVSSKHDEFFAQFGL